MLHFIIFSTGDHMWNNVLTQNTKMLLFIWILLSDFQSVDGFPWENQHYINGTWEAGNGDRYP